MPNSFLTKMGSKQIKAHPKSNNPTAVWQELKSQQTVKQLYLESPEYEVPKDKVRVVCISDSHSHHSELKDKIPSGDVLIHAGDFTWKGKKEEVIDFNSFLGTLPHKHKLVIAGNHELTFDPALGCKEDMKQLLTNCTYLEDRSVTIYGIKFYGSPWQPEFGNWAFNLKRGDACLSKWNLIPKGIDVLITHGPCLGHGDLVQSGERVGCVELLSSIQKRIKPKYHIFGHIHEGYGVTTDGFTTFVNASICNLQYEPVNLPIVFDYPLPVGQVKEQQ